MNAHKALKLIQVYVTEALSQIDGGRPHEARKCLIDANMELTKLLGTHVGVPENMTQQEFTKMIHVKGSPRVL